MCDKQVSPPPKGKSLADPWRVVNCTEHSQAYPFVLDSPENKRDKQEESKDKWTHSIGVSLFGMIIVV